MQEIYEYIKKNHILHLLRCAICLLNSSSTLEGKMKQARKSPTIREVAAIAGVSPSTVSLILNNKGSLSEETRARVHSAIKELNYSRPETTVRSSLSKGTATTSEPKPTLRFLKIATHGQTVNRDHNHFISDFIDGMLDGVARHGYSLQVDSYTNPGVDQILLDLSQNDAMGFVILGTELSRDDVLALKAANRPLVFLDTYYPYVDASFVDMNNEDAVHAVLQFMQATGYKRIGFVGGDAQVANFQLRSRAFQRSKKELGFTCRSDDLVDVGTTQIKAYEDSARFLTRHETYADCYFCANDVIAFGFVKALKERAIRVPEDVGVIGFDNLPMSATMDPALTTIEVSKQKMGEIAVSILADLIRDGGVSASTKVLVGAELILRASTLSHEGDNPTNSNSLNS
jgi:LacI family transcriptional regulator